MKRWLVAGSLLGALVAAIVFAPAAWLTEAVNDATGGHVVLAEPRGTVWTGSAVPVLTGGPGSRDASALPGRLYWRVRPEGLALVVRASHACCLDGEQRLRLVPGLGRLSVEFAPPAASHGRIGQWPASWLIGLGTPWNTLEPSGTLLLSSPGLTIELVGGRWNFAGRAELEMSAMASRISTLDVLGSYRMAITGDTGRGQATTLQLSTISGALRLNGSGQFAAGRLRFRGDAQAAPGAEAALNNLLNIIGRRQGARSLISIG